MIGRDFKSDLSLCPSCGYFSFRVIESRKSKLARRRRFGCDKCSHRATTHEVSDDFFQEAKRNLYVVEQLQKLMGGQPLSSEADLKPINRCSDCHHNVDGSHCSFDFPEYDTPDSYDCNHFQLFKSK
jgi:hypothetical protein